MYRLGENTIKRRHHRMVFYGIGVILLLAGGVYARQNLRATTVIADPPPPTVKSVAADSSAMQHIDEPLFALDLPKDWKLESHRTQGFNVYSWHSSDTETAGRLLSIYIDSIPASLGVNRAVLVKSDGDRLIPSGEVSDNCASFTSKSAGAPLTASPAKWSGINFLCDLGNYLRDVVGTVSSDGLNRVELTGGTSGRHALFFTYTDNNIEPDFTIFTNALQSFKLK